VNERMSDLLDLASDDGGAPLGFSGAAVLRQARTRRRRRHGGVAVGLSAAAVAGLFLATQLGGQVGGPSRSGFQDPTSTAPTSPSAPTLTAEQQAITDQCARLHTPAPPVRVPRGQDGQQGLHLPAKGAKIQDSSTAGPPATFLKAWTIDAYARDGLGVTATFVNPAHTRWAACDIAAGGTQDAAGIWTSPLPAGPVPRSWFGPNGYRHQGNTVSWSQVCAPGEGKVCGRELFAGTLVRYAGVATVRVDAPDGSVLTPVLGHFTYVFRHAEQRVAAHRAADDEQTLPSMPVTLLDGHGKKIIRYDYFPSYVLPGGCPSTGGC
jgi:hypothetical protein